MQILIHQNELVVKLHVLKQFKRFLYGFKEGNHGFQLMLKMHQSSKMVKNYSGIELVWLKIMQDTAQETYFYCLQDTN